MHDNHRHRCACRRAESQAPRRQSVAGHGPNWKRCLERQRGLCDRIFDQTRNAAYEIIKRKKATYYAIGLGLLAIVEAVLRDQHTVLTVASPLTGQYGVTDMAISLPTIIGRRGIEEVLNLPLSTRECASFQQSAQMLKARLAELG